MLTWYFVDQPSATHVDRIAEVLRGGGVVLMPTDTIYGLHALATDAAAVDRVTSAKGRDEQKPFVVLGAGIDDFESIGVVFSDQARGVLNELWPAPLTAILPLRASVAASRGASTLAVRVPRLEWLRRLTRASGPLVSTSANRSGEPPVTAPSQLAQDMHEFIDAVLDGGPREGEPSAIVDFTGDQPRLVRSGDHFFTQRVRKTLRKSL